MKLLRALPLLTALPLLFSCGNGSADETPGERAEALIVPGRPLPASVAEAAGGRWDRMDNIARAWVREYMATRGSFAAAEGFGPWETQDDMALRKIAAGLYVIKYQGFFPDLGEFLGQRQAFLASARRYLSSHPRAYAGLGSREDYDMVLKEVATLMFSFLDDRNPDDGSLLVHNDMVWGLICQKGDGGCDAQAIATFSGQDTKLKFRAGPYDWSETENHVLMIHTWRYLVNDYVKWVGDVLHRTDQAHPRYDGRIRQLYLKDPARYDNDGAAGQPIVNLLLSALGRPLHNGMFEENSKVYESLSLHAALNVVMGANKLFVTESGSRLKAAAKNMVDFLAAKHALQSFEGKRYAPFRRNYDYRRRLGIGNNDYVGDMLGILSGAYSWSDGATDPVFHQVSGTAYPNSRYSSDAIGAGYEIDGAAGHALWTGIFADETQYELHGAIHDLSLNKHNGYFLRMNTLFTLDHYGRFSPKYFDSNGVAIKSGTRSTSPEFYFMTPTFANVSGGWWRQYFNRREFQNLLGNFLEAGSFGIFDTGDDAAVAASNTYNWISVPYAIIPRGDVGRFWGIKGDDRALTQADVPLMVGNRTYQHESRNIWTYKNFSYGYHWFESGDVDRHTRWPQDYPSSWGNGLEFQINRASFRVIDRRASEGYYVIMALVSKSDLSDRELYNYGRGFWEVVPGHLFADANALKARVVAYNPTTNFPNRTSSGSGTKHYWYKLAVSGDTLMLDQKMGADPSCQAIMEIKNHQGTVMSLDRELTNHCSDASLRAMPLIEAREVDTNFRFTGRSYAHGAGDGRVRICNPFTDQQLMLDSSDYRYPSQSTQISGGCPETQPTFSCSSAVRHDWKTGFGSNGWNAIWGDAVVETANNRLRLSYDDVVERAASFSGGYAISYQVTLPGGTVLTPSVQAFAPFLPSLRRVGDGIELGGDSYGGSWSFDNPAGFAYQTIYRSLVAKVTTYVKASSGQMAMKVEGDGRAYRSGFVSLGSQAGTNVARFRLVGQNNSMVHHANGDQIYVGPISGCQNLSDADIEARYAQ
jgi:hypothetical protein